MTENDLEQACIDWFRELGWEYSHGETISPGGFAPERAHYNEVVLAPRFRAALESLNPDLPATAIDDAEKRVLQFAGQSLVEANRDLYVWLRDGIPVDIEQDGHRRQVAVVAFDWNESMSRRMEGSMAEGASRGRVRSGQAGSKSRPRETRTRAPAGLRQASVFGNPACASLGAEVLPP
mgnify:CR=1 FL=1